MLADEYQTIEALTESSITDRGSVFTAAVAPADSADQLAEWIKEYKQRNRGSKDWVITARIGFGEEVTVHTEGEEKFCQAVLKTIDTSRLTHIVIAVHRNSAGKAASVQTYQDAALNAIQHGKIVKRILYESLQFEVPPADMTLVTRLITDGRAKIMNTKQGDPNIVFVKIRKVQVHELIRTLSDKTNGRAVPIPAAK